MTSLWSLLLFWALILLHESYAPNPLDPSQNEYWFREGKLEIRKRLKRVEEIYGKDAVSKLRAKSVVFFMGDGMGMSTITASRHLKAQQDKDNLHINNLVFDKFPFVSLAKVNSYNSPVADSGSSSTAYLGGVKANLYTIGVNTKVNFQNCTAQMRPENHVLSAFEWAQGEGKATGFATPMTVTHASTAGLYAHTASRQWEVTAPLGCMDTALQLMSTETGQNIRVILGGGWSNMRPLTHKTETCRGRRYDERNLMDEWTEANRKRGSTGAFAASSETLKQINTNSTDYLLGLFAENNLEFSARKKKNSTEPTLTEMALKALKMLQKEKNGFFLFIEGGLIEVGHQWNRAYLALTETLEFVKAIEAVLAKVDLSETLVIVTADHSHSMSLNGYPSKEDNILSHVSENNDFVYTAISYGNGPGYQTFSTGKLCFLTHKTCIFVNIDGIGQWNYTYRSALYREFAANSGEDVPVYAIGAGAHLFTGVYDQTFIAHAVRYLLGSKRNKGNKSSNI